MNIVRIRKAIITAAGLLLLLGLQLQTVVHGDALKVTELVVGIATAVTNWAVANGYTVNELQGKLLEAERREGKL